MRSFWNEQAKWSESIFGDSKSRGPTGPLLHLRKEVEEAIKELEELESIRWNGNIDPIIKDQKWLKIKERLLNELVDCQFLVFDAARRTGFKYDEFVAACFAKLAVNKKREWPKPTSDTPVEHVREPMTFLI